jgi:hypothetical protein
MSPTSSRIARILAVAGGALAIAAAPVATASIAVADPADLVPLCQGDESPGEDNCRTPCPGNAPVSPMGQCTQPGTVDITGGPSDDLSRGAPGADPQVPLGTNPNEVIYGGDI